MRQLLYQGFADIISNFQRPAPSSPACREEEIELGIRNGVRKINVDTDNRLAMTGAIRKVLWERPEKLSPTTVCVCVCGFCLCTHFISYL